MKIVRIGQGTWNVYATCVGRDACPVLDFIGELGEKRGDAVLSDLQQFVPNTSPEHWIRVEFSEKLTGWPDLYEFRWSTKGGGTPRILWFYDDNKVVVCTYGVNKKGKLKKKDIRLADKIREDYFAEKEKGNLIIVEIEDLDEGEEMEE